VLSVRVAATGQWQAWRRLDARLAPYSSLAEAAEPWQRQRDNRPYGVVAALTSIGSHRGHDDHDAALCVVILLSDGIRRIGRDLHDLCQPADVVSAVWEEVKRAEPTPGDRAARHLLRRARQRLLRPETGFNPKGPSQVSLEAWMAERLRVGGARREVATPEEEDPAAELEDLLMWAERLGLVLPRDADLIRDIVAAFHLTDEYRDAMSLVGRRHGLAPTTVRHRRDAVLERLRQALPDYLEATA
jgi:hypothetical protein